jgi:hypothetical protein
MTTGILLVTVFITDAEAADEAKTVAVDAGNVRTTLDAVFVAVKVMSPPELGALSLICPDILNP